MAQFRNDDHGFAIAMVSLLLIPLIGFMALAIDVGAWYTQATRVQAAADAGALAGTIWMPDIDSARIVAAEAISKNGIDLTETAESPSRERWELVIEPDPSNSFALLVTLTDTAAPVYFSAPFLDNVEITRQALAEYVTPVRLGSPESFFGNDLVDGCVEPSEAGCSPAGVTQPGFWPFIMGKSSNAGWGDAHSTDCIITSHCDIGDVGDYGNADYRESGFLYAIEIPESAVGQVIEIKGYDLSFNPRSSPTLDRGTTSNPTLTELTLFEADGNLLTTPLNAVHPTSACSQVLPADAYPHLTWETHCSFVPTSADIYPLRIRTSGFVGANDAADRANFYSLKAENASGGEQPFVYAINDMAMRTSNNCLDATPCSSRFHLAEITSRSEGDLLLRLWDAGDAQDTQSLELRIDTPYGTADTCEFRAYERLETPPAWQTSGTSGDSNDNCSIVTSEPSNVEIFDNQWLEIRIPIPAVNNCEALAQGCWWYVDYLTTNPSGDRIVDATTWEASVIGDPVRLSQ